MARRITVTLSSQSLVFGEESEKNVLYRMGSNGLTFSFSRSLVYRLGQGRVKRKLQCLLLIIMPYCLVPITRHGSIIWF